PPQGARRRLAPLLRAHERAAAPLLVARRRRERRRLPGERAALGARPQPAERMRPHPRRGRARRLRADRGARRMIRPRSIRPAALKPATPPRPLPRRASGVRPRELTGLSAAFAFVFQRLTMILIVAVIGAHLIFAVEEHSIAVRLLTAISPVLL